MYTTTYTELKDIMQSERANLNLLYDPIYIAFLNDKFIKTGNRLVDFEGWVVEEKGRYNCKW